MIDIISSISLHDALLITHVIGLVLGYGVAISIDFLLLRALLSRRLSPIILDVAQHAARLTTLGLLILWLSGIGFLFEYRNTAPEKLENPKIYAKIIIVTLLSLNGYLIHRFVFPTLWRYAGKDVLGLASSRVLLVFCVCAAISTVSWIFPLILGLNSALNFSYPAEELLVQYVVSVLFGISVFSFSLLIWFRYFCTHRANVPCVKIVLSIFRT